MSDEPAQISRQRAVASRQHPEVTAKPGSLKTPVGDTLLKVRYEEGNVITYRKHWLVLLRKTGLPG